MKIEFALILLVSIAVHATGSMFRFLGEDEPTACELATENITGSDLYAELSDILDEDITNILNNTIPSIDLCSDEKVDGYTMCAGTLSPLVLNSYETHCNKSMGQVVMMKNVRITCNPDAKKTDDQTYTRIEKIPLCIGKVCDKDEAKTAVTNKLKQLGKMGIALNGAPGSCMALQGSSAFSITTLAKPIVVILSVATSWMLW